MKSRLKLREAIAIVSFHFTLNVLPDLESEFFILSKYDTYQLKKCMGFVRQRSSVNMFMRILKLNIDFNI